MDGSRLGPALVSRLVGDVAPTLAGEPVRGVDVGGTTSRVFRVGAGHAARFPADSEVGALRVEHRAMASFEAVCPVDSPRPVAVGRPSERWPRAWSLQTWVEGEVATPGGLAGSDRFADDLATLVTSLRCADTGGRTFTGSGRGGRLLDHDAWVQECLRRSEGLLPTSELSAQWSDLRELPRGDDPDVMSHADLIPPNLLVADERLVGVLDTGSFGPTDPALDLVAGWHLLDTDRRDRLRRALDVGDAEWERGAAWAFEQAIGLVWFYETSHPTMAALGRSTLARLLADL